MSNDDIAIAALVRVKTAIMALHEAHSSIGTWNPLLAEALLESLRHANRAERLCHHALSVGGHKEGRLTWDP